MSKNKIGEICRKRIVTGPKSDVMPGEIHADDVFKNSNTETGGGELEGTNYLIKPNGRYWKFNFLRYPENTINKIQWWDFNEEQQDAITTIYLYMLGYYSFVYTCVGQKVVLGGLVPPHGLYYTTYGKIQANLGYSAGRMEYDTDKVDVFSCLAWQEAYPIINDNMANDLAEVLPVGTQLTSLFDVLKLMFEADTGTSLSDEEVYAVLSEMFMIEPILKEEYEDLVSRAEDENY